jgi:protein-disulfide isomerase
MMKDIAFEEQQRLIKEKINRYSNAAMTTPDNRHIYGSLHAEFTLVEFSDLECPYCKSFHRTLKSVIDESDDKINWEWRHFPLHFHNPVATVEAIAAECVAEKKGNTAFWVFIDDIFNHSKMNGKGVSNLNELVTSLGIEPSWISDCVSDKKHEEKVQLDINQGRNAGVSGTPSVLVIDNITGKSELIKGKRKVDEYYKVIARFQSQRRVSINQ